MPGLRTQGEGMDGMASADDLKRAVDLALAGDWDGAHAIAQSDESDPLFCWLHACLHRIEAIPVTAATGTPKPTGAPTPLTMPKAELQAIRAAAS